MKLTILIMTVFLLQVSAASRAQINLTAKQESLRKVLDKISQQSGYDFVYNDQALDKAKPVTLKLNNASIQIALKSAFEGQPLVYELSDKTVMIKKKEVSFLENIIARFQAIDVRGRVVNEKNEPLAGATVTVKDKNQITKTDSQGYFYLQNVDDKATLLISFVGFKTMEMDVKEDLGIVTLKLEDNSLEQVQVIAYGEVKQKFLTSNAASVRGDVIRDQPVTNPLIALQGLVPGLFIKQGSGLSSATLNVTVQGRNSIDNAGTPFYVVDGVPIVPNSIGTAISGNTVTGPTSNLSYLNPNEIESITVLKDADATAIYGSRAANGAILITTRRGKAGQTRVDLNLQNGWGKVAKPLKLLNTEQYIGLRKEAYANNNNQAIPPSAVEINGVFDPNRNVDWQKEILGETAQFQNLQATLSGGSEQTQFLAGAGYIRETPVFIGDFSNVKASVNFNVNHTSNDKKFKFFLSGSYLENTNVLPTEDITDDATALAPNFPALYNPDGTINWFTVAGIYPFQVSPRQPAAKINAKYTIKASNLVANSTLSYEAAPGLSFKSTFGYNGIRNDDKALYPLIAQIPGDIFDGLKANAKFSNKNLRSWIIEPQATYTRSFDFGSIDALIGTTFQNTENNLLTLFGEEYSNDAQLGDFNAAGKKSTIGSIQSVYKYAAVFARLNYRLKDRYIVNLAARRDGSSRFGVENRMHSFYSLGWAWIFSEEKFMQSAFPFMNYGKLRASYGTTGNDQIGDYRYLSLYNVIGVSEPYLGLTGITPAGLSNPYLQWEETRKLNIGIDLGFLNNSINITTNYFRNRSTNQLLSQNLSEVAGFSGILRNLPALVQNTGWEFTFAYSPFKESKFNWQGSFNLTLPRNKLVKYGGIENTVDNNIYKVGEPLAIIKAFSFAGVNPETGIYQFRTQKGELVNVPSNGVDQTAIVDLTPKWYGGFGNTFTYKNFSLDAFFQFASQNGPNLKYDRLPGYSFNQNQIVEVLDHWKKPGDNTPFQKVSRNFTEVIEPWGAARGSDAAFSRINYARLTNAVLSYTVASTLATQLHLSSARLYLQGRNLLTISNMKNGDPETPSFNTASLLKIYTVGIQLTF